MRISQAVLSDVAAAVFRQELGGIAEGGPADHELRSGNIGKSHLVSRRIGDGLEPLAVLAVVRLSNRMIVEGAQLDDLEVSSWIGLRNSQKSDRAVELGGREGSLKRVFGRAFAEELQEVLERSALDNGTPVAILMADEVPARGVWVSTTSPGATEREGDRIFPLGPQLSPLVAGKSYTPEAYFGALKVLCAQRKGAAPNGPAD